MALQDYLIQRESHRSALENELRRYPLPIVPGLLSDAAFFGISFSPVGQYDVSSLRSQFPDLLSDNHVPVLEGKASSVSVSEKKRVAVLFSGGPAPGGHNVVVGIGKALGDAHTLFGVKAGPKGLINGDLFEIKSDQLAHIVNQGGFDFLGSDRTKIKTEAQFQAVLNTVKTYQLNSIIIVGGDDSNTNACILAQYLKPHGCTVIGVPKTIDGDLQVPGYLPISFGFDTATKIYAEMVGNILQDTPSSRKYWHFVKLMGRSASHVALEVALKTAPSVALISEEVWEKQLALDALITHIVTVIGYRAGKGLAYGVVLVPEGLIEFIPDLRQLIDALNDTVARLKDFASFSIEDKKERVLAALSSELKTLFLSLPLSIQNQLVMDRDSHGNLQVSQIDTEQLLVQMVAAKLKTVQSDPKAMFSSGSFHLSDKEIEKFKAFSFKAICHFLGYEGRCGAPSLFDAAYTYNLGIVAGALALGGYTGYMAAITDIHCGGRAIAVPLSGLITVERRDGKEALVIQKALVQLDSPAFRYFESRRVNWAQSDVFCNPGPRQFWGPVAQDMPICVALNEGYAHLVFDLGSVTQLAEVC